MISQEEGIVSVAQTMLRMRYPNVAVGRDEISSVVNECARLLPNGLSEEIKARIICGARNQGCNQCWEANPHCR